MWLTFRPHRDGRERSTVETLGALLKKERSFAATQGNAAVDLAWTFRSTKKAGKDQPSTEANQAMREPSKTPYAGSDHIATFANTATLAPPNIIGPAAPRGTVGP